MNKRGFISWKILLVVIILALLIGGWYFVNINGQQPHGAINPIATSTIPETPLALSAPSCESIVKPSTGPTPSKPYVVDLSIQAFGNFNILLFDPLGRRVGYLSPGMSATEIPGSSYAANYPIANDEGQGSAMGGIRKDLFIRGAIAGTYCLEAIIPGTMPFSIAIGTAGKGIKGSADASTTSYYQIDLSQPPPSTITISSLFSGNSSSTIFNSLGGLQ